MANIPFLISRLDAEGNKVESHVAVTDKEGSLDTSRLPKVGNKVNSLDSYASKGRFTDGTKLDSGVGIWFGEESARAEGKGALIYGNYLIEELSSKGNMGKDLLETKLIVNEERMHVVFTDGAVIEMDNLVNLDVLMESDLIDVASGTNAVTFAEKAKVADTVTWKHLTAGRTYKIKTEIYHESNEGSIIKLGEKTISFTPKKTVDSDIVSGTVRNTVTVNTLDIVDGKIHAVDYIYLVKDGEEILIASHNKEMTEERQILGCPRISTIARDGYTNNHIGTATKEGKVIDRVLFENLPKHAELKFEAKLRFADTGEELATVELIAKVDDVKEVKRKSDGIYLIPGTGELDMPEFSFDASALGNRTLVVTEVIYDAESGEKFIEHYDLTDEGQSVHYIDVGTVATDEVTSGHTGAVIKTDRVIDLVKIENCIVGETYTVKGKFINKDTMEVVAEGEATITAKESVEYAKIIFEVDGTALSGASCVAFEYVYHNDVKVGGHEDPEDENQIINYPEIRTTAVDSKTKSHTGIVSEKAVIVDIVELKNLTVGDSYRVIGTLMYNDGSTLVSTNAVASDIFVATEKNMTLEMTFELDSRELAGTSFVVFEKLYHANENTIDDEDGNAVLAEEDKPLSEHTEIEVARHEDPNDERQTVWIPEIATEARDAHTEENHGEARKTGLIIDKITLTNLVVGEEYTVTGFLMNQMTGEKYIDADGKEVEGTPITFVAEKTTEVKEMVFEFNGSNLNGVTVVVFENLYHKDVIVASHHDINSKPQSVNYPPEVPTTDNPPEKPRGGTPNTGDSNGLATHIMLSGVALVSVLTAASRRRLK